jgi:hypothetical protein
MPWFKKPSDGVIGLTASLGKFTHSNLFRIWNKIKKSKVSWLYKSSWKKLALDLQYTNASNQNSIVSINNQKENAKLAQEVLTNTNIYWVSFINGSTWSRKWEFAQNTALLDYKLAEIQVIKAKGELKTLTNK